MPGSAENTAVSATASLSTAGTAVTITNRHYDQPASVSLMIPAAVRVTQALILTADDPRAVNSVSQPDRVQPAALSVAPDGAGRWRVELPPHSLATIQFV